jgi:adenylyltransferase/sulfurtransferase
MLRTGCADVLRLQTSAGRIATTPVSASIIGAVQVQEAMKIIHTQEGEDAPFKTLAGKMWSYEGMTATSHVFKHAMWKEDCPAHTCWNNVIQCPLLTADNTVSQALEIIKNHLKVSNAEINMMNNKFINRIISDQPEKVFDIRIPESHLDAFIQQNEEIRKLSYKTLFHKDFIENIDVAFPYPEMRLVDVGIPYYDVVQVATEKGLFYVELTADASRYLDE